MTWPFENDTSTIIKKLAKADLKEHRLKTLITAIIIVIATCLMATVFSILVNDALKQSTQAPYHAMFRAVSEDTISYRPIMILKQLVFTKLLVIL